MPLDQWLYFDALECLPEDEELLPSPEDCHPVRTGGDWLKSGLEEKPGNHC